MKQLIHVTDRHIERGIGGSVKACAVAVAVEEALPQYEAGMGFNSLILIHVLSGKSINVVNLPTSCFVSQFDKWRRGNAERPSPISFEIEIPDQETAQKADCAPTVVRWKRFDEVLVAK